MPVGGVVSREGGVDTMPASPELQSSAPAPQPNDDSQQPQPATTSAQPQQDAPSPQPTTGSSSTPMADDADLIEKEWVVRAKSLVEKTKDDPFLQNKEISKVKADYIKKRYNKDMKVSED